MKYRTFSVRRALVLAALPLLSVLSACERGGTGSEDPPRLTIHGARTLNALGDTLWVRVTATNADGEVLDVSGAQWSSSAPQVATATGAVIQAVGVGTTTLSVTLRGATATAQVEVRQVPARVQVTTPKDRVAIGESAQLTAQVLDSMDAPIPGAAFQWSSHLPEVASVSQTGGLTGLGTGRARITATAAGMSGGTDVSVYYAGTDDTFGPEFDPVRLSVSPASISLTGPDSVVTATVYAEDPGNGIVTVAFKVGKDGPLYSCTMNNPTAGNGQRGTWSCPIRRGVLAGAGTYRFYELSVFDAKGSGWTANAENLEAFNKQAYFTITP